MVMCMKKWMLLTVTIVLFVTGCGKEETVSCSKIITYEEYGSVSDKTVATFEKKKLKMINIERTFVFHDKEMAQENKEIIDMSALSYKVYGYETSTSIDGNKILLKADADIENVVLSESNTALDKVNKETTKEKYILLMEDDGYTCK